METEEKKKPQRTVIVPTTNLEIPADLAYLMELSARDIPIHTERNWIIAVGRVPSISTVKNDLPSDIDDFLLPRLFRDHGIQFNLEFRSSPLESPIVAKTTDELEKKSISVFKLILRFTFDDTMTQAQEHLIGNYIVQTAMQNLQMREEIYLQVMNQCINYTDEIGLKRLWLLMANLLSACKPGDRIKNYVIKFVSDHGIHGWSTVCQMKILAAKPQCRLFPPCSLEWKANKKSSRAALSVMFIDGQDNTLNIDSFTVSEEFARHALSIRADSLHGINGWTTCLQFENKIIEMGGHGYVLDPLSCIELRSYWTKIGGSDGNMFFLRSKSNKGSSPYDLNDPENSTKGMNSNQQSTSQSHQILNAGVHPVKVMSVDSPRANMRSTELADWLEDVFDQALPSEPSMDARQTQGWIHGLEDRVPLPYMPVGAHGVVMPGMTGASAPPLGLATPGIVGIPDPMLQAQNAQLQAAIQQAQLQNTLLQHNLQREMLVSQLNQLQVANSAQYQQVQVPQQTISQMMSPQELLSRQQPVQAQIPVLPDQQRNQHDINKKQTQIANSNQQHVGADLVEPNGLARGSPENDGGRMKYSSTVLGDQSNHRHKKQHHSHVSEERLQDHETQPSRLTDSKNELTGRQSGTDPPRLFFRSQSSVERGGPDEDDALKNRAKPVKIGSVSWPPPVADSAESKMSKKEPKRLFNREDIQKQVSIEKRITQEKSSMKVAMPAVPTSKSEKSSNPYPVTKNYRNSGNSVDSGKSKDQLEETSEIPTATSMPPSKTVRSSVFMTLDSPSKNAVSLTTQHSHVSRKMSPPASASSIILTEDDIGLKETRTLSKIRVDEVPHVDVADRARLLANQLFLGTHDGASDSSTKVEKKAEEITHTTETWFTGHQTKLLTSGPEARHYMYTLVPWNLMVRKEIFSPDERLENPLLLDLLFLQIVYDILKQPCIRLSKEDESKFNELLDAHDITFDMKDLKKQSKQVKKIFVDAAKATQFYFGRFYAAEWHSASTNMYPIHWVMVNHNGVHFVHHQENDTLKSVKMILFQDILNVSRIDSRILSISTRNNDSYELVCHMVDSLKILIQSYRTEAERMPKPTNASVKRTDSQASHLRNKFSEGTNAVVMRRQSENRESGTELRIGSGVPGLLSIPDESDDIINYGMKYFKENSRSDVEESLRWSKAPLQTSLHHFENHGDERLAVEAFIAILTFMGEYPLERNTGLFNYTLVLLEIAQQKSELISEIYCQLVKQTRPVDAEHPSGENLKSCWRLFSIFAMFFECTSQLKPYLLRYLQEMSKIEDLAGIVGAVIKNLEQTHKYGGRKILPIRSELTAQMDGYSAKVITMMMPGNLKASFQIAPITVIEEVIDELCAMFSLSHDMEKSEYTVFSILTKKNISSPLRGEQYVFDVITELSHTGQPFHFYFFRTCWIADLQLRSRSQALIDLMFRQVIEEYLTGSWLLSPINDGVTMQARDIARIAAIQQKVTNPIATTITGKELKSFLPTGVSNYQSLRDNEWLTQAKSHLKQFLKYTSIECKAECLQILRGWFLFGAMCFEVHTAHGSILPGQKVVLCLSRSGMILLDSRNHKFLMNIPYTDIFSYEATFDSTGPTQVDLKISDDRTIRCFSNQANKIVHILNQYMKVSNGN